VIVFNIINVRLETCGVRDSNASSRACLAGYDKTACAVAVGIERAQLRPGSGDWCCGFDFGPTIVSGRHRGSCIESGAASVIVARRRQRRIRTLLLRIRRQNGEYTKAAIAANLMLSP
jgi:hypothetical protein